MTSQCSYISAYRPQKYLDHHPDSVDTHAFRTLTASCGDGWGEGGDPLSIVAEDAYEVEIYVPATYLEQDLTDELRERFETTREDFSRFSIELNDMNRFVSVVVDCCGFERSGLAGGARKMPFRTCARN